MHEILWIQKHRQLVRSWQLERQAMLRQQLLVLPHTSTSHSAGIRVSIASRHPVGIDIERLRSRHPAFGGFVASSAELDHMPSCWRASPTAAWAAKEACFKLGLGGFEPRDFTIIGRTAQTIVIRCGTQHATVDFLELVWPHYVVAIAREKTKYVR